MKKTTFILALSLSAIMALSGCANNTTNDQAVIDKLSTGLDRVTNTVSAVSIANIDDISRDDFGGNAQFSAQSIYSGASQPAAAITKNIESNRYQILRKAKNLKKRITGGELTLGNENARAISELTSSMQKYATELSRTRSDYNNTVRSIAKLDDANSQFNAKLTRLSCCLKSRDCYMNNILNSLNNVESILDAIQNNAETQSVDDTEPNADTKDWGNKTPDDYADQSPTNTATNTQNYNTPNFNLPQNFNNSTYGYNCPDGNCYPNTYCPNGNCYPNTYCPDGNCFNAPANCKNGVCYNTAGMNGFVANRGIFNPNRNTDTYGPSVTNIDTYRYTGNGYGAGYGYGINGQGVRHFNGSNGVNNVMPTDDFNSEPKNEIKNEAITNGAIINETITNQEKTNEAIPAVDSEKQVKENSEEKISENTSRAEGKDVKKVISSSEKKENGVTRPQPKKAETMQVETENKVKSVSAETAKEAAEQEKVDSPAAEDKVKGHTTATQADINEDIKQLLNK